MGYEEPGLEMIKTEDTKIDYEAENKKLKAECNELRAHVKYLEARIEEFCHEREVARLHGVIEGLKFSIRCNGVSGGEVE